MARSVGLFSTFLARCLQTKSPTRFIQTWHHSCQMTLCKKLARGSSAERLKPFNHSSGGNYEVQRQFSAGAACYQKPTVHKLSSRGIVRVAGADAGVFLQGLITNDVNLITASKTAMYAMLLNVQGRVMYDLIVYNTATDPGNPVFLVECDSSLTDSLVKDIRKYKLRKKIDISDVTTELHVSAVIPPGNSDSAELPVPESECVMFTPDPRVKRFGWRLVSTADGPLPGEGVLGTEADYHSYRYQWGVSEGCLDLPPGNCFPLESNLVYLHGASFQKGCYIGQELTARTYHTGVTRKRLMPLLLQQPLGEVPAGTDIKTDANKLAGKYRHSVGKYGLGLLRLEHVKSKLVIKTESGQTLDVQTEIPSWWPSDPEG